MAYTSAQIAIRTAGNGVDPGIFSPGLAGPFTPPPIERSQYPGFSHTAAPQDQTRNNIMNRKADSNSSLYQICMNLKRRLAKVPGFDDFIADMEQDEQNEDESPDPVTLMWNMLRQGFPLLAIYNALGPKVPLEVDQSGNNETKIGKKVTFKFLEACIKTLHFPSEELFLITDLYGSDTTGFVKVTKIVNKVLDLLDERGLLQHTMDGYLESQDTEPQARSHRQFVIDELVRSERDYVQHLETLQQFKNQIEQLGVIPGDSIHDIFLNLNALLDFQRRFLIRIEQQNSLDESLQNWGVLFVQYQDAFKVYEPFIANQKRCNVVVSKDWDKLRGARVSENVAGMIESEAVLLGFLMKPFQRLTKYPLLLQDLRKKGGLDQEKQNDLADGEMAASSVLVRANEAVDKEERNRAVSDLTSRVEDWKGHNIDNFGELLLYGSHTVLKGEGQKEVEREYKIYLFHRILLCCKEINPNKPKNRLGNSSKSLGKPRLQLKGRIFMQNVTDVISFSKSGKHDSLLKIRASNIFWKGDPGVENFIVRFQNEEIMNKWRSKVEDQRNRLNESARSSGQTGTSDTEFSYMKSAALKNPYKQEDDGEEEEDERTARAAALAHSSRNTSSTSLRSRSTTGGSGPPTGQVTGRVPPPRFPIPDHVHGLNGPPLNVSTNFSSGSPMADDQPGDSYFSPTIESPVSTRSSTQVSTYPFPRQPNASYTWTSDEQKHKTAPAVARAPSRPGQQVLMNTYIVDGRTVQRPSLPAMTAAQQLNLAQSRNRSVSTPDIHNHPANLATRRYNGQGTPPVDAVPVPPLPPHMTSMRAPVNRSQSNSPTSGQLPTRQGTQSPKLMRERAPQYGHDQAPLGSSRSDLRQHQVPSLANATMSSGVGQRMGPATIGGEEEILPPQQLKVKIWFDPEPNYVTIVVPRVIKHRSLIDRIDSKMERVVASSIAKGTARLRYHDSEGDAITIGCDDDVQEAIAEWQKVHEEKLKGGAVPDFELYWSKIS